MRLVGGRTTNEKWKTSASDMANQWNKYSSFFFFERTNKIVKIRNFWSNALVERLYCIVMWVNWRVSVSEVIWIEWPIIWISAEPFNELFGCGHRLSVTLVRPYNWQPSQFHFLEIGKYCFSPEACLECSNISPAPALPLVNYNYANATITSRLRWWFRLSTVWPQSWLPMPPVLGGVDVATASEAQLFAAHFPSTQIICYHRNKQKESEEKKILDLFRFVSFARRIILICLSATKFDWNCQWMSAADAENVQIGSC